MISGFPFFEWWRPRRRWGIRGPQTPPLYKQPDTRGPRPPPLYKDLHLRLGLAPPPRPRMHFQLHLGLVGTFWDPFGQEIIVFDRFYKGFQHFGQLSSSLLAKESQFSSGFIRYFSIFGVSFGSLLDEVHVACTRGRGGGARDKGAWTPPPL